MTKEAYGIPVPRGVRKDWSALPFGTISRVLRQHPIPSEWGEPVNCVGWYDRFARLRLCVGHYANGRSATVRIDANGVSRTVFGEVGNG